MNLQEMSLLGRIALTWIILVGAGVIGLVVTGITRVIMNSAEPWFWIGMIAAICFTVWAVIILAEEF